MRSGIKSSRNSHSHTQFQVVGPSGALYQSFVQVLRAACLASVYLKIRLRFVEQRLKALLPNTQQQQQEQQQQQQPQQQNTMKKFIVVFVALFGAAVAQQSFKCPDDFGFYPHETSCDKYWKCDNGVSELKTCGNGLAFDATDSKFLTENCDYLHNVECGERTELEPPITTPHCSRLYGIFPDENKCDVFWNCWNGEPSRYQCSPGLAYDRDARVCMWADQVPECKNEEVANGFACPAAGELANTGSFSRHAHPEDCRKYYICLEGVAREYGCPIGTVFKIGDSDGTGNCEDPEDVPGCEDYYGDLDLKSIRKSELLAGLNTEGRTKSAPKTKAATS